MSRSIILDDGGEERLEMNNKIVLGAGAVALTLGLGAQAVKPLPEVPAGRRNIGVGT
jgi:hypothetical protein